MLDVTIDQMLSGVPSDNDSGWTWRLPPVGFSRRTLERIIAKLKAKGALTIEVVHRTCQRICLNFLWTPMEGVMSLLVPKNRKNVDAETDDEISGLSVASSLTAKLAGKKNSDDLLTANLAGIDRQSGGPIKQNDKHNEENHFKPSLRSAGADLPVPGRIRQRTRPTLTPESQEPSPVPAAPSRTGRALDVFEDKTEAAVARWQREGVESRKQKAAAARERDSSDAYHTTYTAAWAETFPGVPCPTWTQNDKHRFRAMIKSRLYDDPQKRHDFVDFVVRNWPQIRSTKFGWMTKVSPPDKPNIQFLTRPNTMSNLLDAFAERQHYGTIRLLPAEQQEVERLIGSGMSRDEALVAVGKRQALSEARGKESEVKRFNGDAIRRAEDARAKARAEQKALMRQRAEQAAQATETKDEEGFPELGDYSLEPLDLPELDYSKWN